MSRLRTPTPQWPPWPRATQSSAASLCPWSHTPTPTPNPPGIKVQVPRPILTSSTPCWRAHSWHVRAVSPWVRRGRAAGRKRAPVGRGKDRVGGDRLTYNVERRGTQQPRPGCFPLLMVESLLRDGERPPHGVRGNGRRRHPHRGQPIPALPPAIKGSRVEGREVRDIKLITRPAKHCSANLYSSLVLLLDSPANHQDLIPHSPTYPARWKIDAECINGDPSATNNKGSSSEEKKRKMGGG